jgi:hypothetical protein
MSIDEQIGKLEALLNRVKRNASQPRPVAAQPVIEPAALALSPSPPAHPAPVASAPPMVEVEALGDDELEELEELDDIVEIQSDSPPAPVQTATEVELDFEEEEEAPQSAPRPAASLGEALGEAAQTGYAGEPPAKTPPPESGRQEVVAQVESLEGEISGADAVDDLLEADLSGGPLSAPARPGAPTMEQLGETVELEGADAPDARLELDEPVSPAAAGPATPSQDDLLEASLPGPSFQGAYDESLVVGQSQQWQR